MKIASHSQTEVEQIANQEYKYGFPIRSGMTTQIRMDPRIREDDRGCKL